MDVLIVGAGLGGLTLANALARNAPHARVTVTERDRDATARTQGYAISLRQRDGLRVLEALGLGDEAMAQTVHNSAFRFLTEAGEPLLTLRPAGPGSPHFSAAIARATLRGLLLSRLGPEVVQWNARATGYRRDAARLVVTYEDGTERSADVVVACDGVHSALRGQLLGDPPRHLGLARIGGIVRGTVAHPLLEGGSFMTLGRGRAVFVQVYADGLCLWSLSMRGREGELASLPPSALRRAAQTATEGWHDPIAELVARTPDDALTARDLYDRPPPRRSRDGALLLLGDASHPMSPFRGQGANMAMVDAWELAQALAVPERERTRALVRFEAAMLARNRKAVADSASAARSLHRESALAIWARNASYRFLDRILERAAAKAGPTARRPAPSTAQPER